jgi:hypothetical protein
LNVSLLRPVVIRRVVQHTAYDADDRPVPMIEKNGMSKKSATVLGYTRTGRPVLLPKHSAPDTNNIDVYRRTKAMFDGWTRGDHVDASRILMEHGEREPDQKAASWCTRWSSVHWGFGGRPRQPVTR